MKDALASAIKEEKRWKKTKKNENLKKVPIHFFWY